MHFTLTQLTRAQNTFFTTILLLLVSFNFASPSGAYQLLNAKWPHPTTTFYVDIHGAEGLWNDSFETAMYYWGVDTVFEYHIVSGAYEDPCDGSEGRNGVAFMATNCGDAWGAGILAVTLTRSTNATITQTDIVFNSNLSWNVYSTPWQSGSWDGVNDFQRVAIHELGHALGLGHEDGGVPTIMGTYAGDITIPQQDDKNGVGAIYGYPLLPVVDRPASITVPAQDFDGNYTVNWGASATGSVTYVLREANNPSFSGEIRTAYTGRAASAAIIGRSIGSTYYYRVKAIRSGYTDSLWTTDPNGCRVTTGDDDKDGMPDAWELDNGLDPTVNDAKGDLDGDGANNLLEYRRNTDPNDPRSKPNAVMPWIPLLLLDE